MPHFLDSLSLEERTIFSCDNRQGVVSYKTEIVIPEENASRSFNLILVLGNPATHSVKNGFPYSFAWKNKTAGTKRRHPFWGKLKDAGILTQRLRIHEMQENQIKEFGEEFKKGNFTSDVYRVFIYPFYSFPTPTTGEYKDVEGIKELFPWEFLKNREIKRFNSMIIEQLKKDNLPSLVIFCTIGSYNCIKNAFDEIIDKKIIIACIPIIGWGSKSGGIMGEELEKIKRRLQRSINAH